MQAPKAQRPRQRQFRLAVRNARQRLIGERQAARRPHDKRVLTIQIRALFRTLKKMRARAAAKR